jgi:hypothetical protein
LKRGSPRRAVVAAAGDPAADITRPAEAPAPLQRLKRLGGARGDLARLRAQIAPQIMNPSPARPAPAPSKRRATDRRRSRVRASQMQDPAVRKARRSGGWPQSARGD